MKFLVLLVISFVAVQAQELEDLSSHNQFTADVYKEVKKTASTSFMTSPLSLDILLALLHTGAKGTTAQQIAKGLHLPDNADEIRNIYSKLSLHLKSSSDYDLSSANKIFLQQGFNINDNFKSEAVDVFNAEVETINFSKVDEAAANINGWVSEKTHNKIRDLIAPSALLGLPASVVVNALYFRGKWHTQFEDKNTVKKEFHLNTKDNAEVDMMYMASHFRRFKSKSLNAKILEMPYEGEDISMVFVLPNEIEGLAALEDRIHEVLATPIAGAGSTIVNIPKFTAETTIEFNSILKALGIELPFTKNADFTGIGANEEPIYLSKLIQKTFIQVEEKGTTAAAASGAIFQIMSPSPRPPPPMLFIADHPFLYYIKVNGAAMFIGRYSGPQ